MKVLVATASKYGATEEIGARIAQVLTASGIETELLDARSVGTTTGFDAVVLGGAVYAGRWPRHGRELLERLGEELSRKPLWVFSSGPLGEPPKPEGPPEGMTQLLEPLGFREHAVFSGKLDRSLLGVGDRAIVSALRAPEGDFRPWDAVEAWARSIAEALL